jgi:hypothetical protein
MRPRAPTRDQRGRRSSAAHDDASGQAAHGRPRTLIRTVNIPTAADRHGRLTRTPLLRPRWR